MRASSGLSDNVGEDAIRFRIRSCHHVWLNAEFRALENHSVCT